MLVLTRKVGERIRIGDSLEVTVLKVSGNKVKLGFAGPVQVPIQREELTRREARPWEVEVGEPALSH